MSLRPRAVGKRFVTSLNWLFTLSLNALRCLARSAFGSFFVLAECSLILLLLSARSSPSFTLRLSVYRFFAAVMPLCFFFFLGFWERAARRLRPLLVVPHRLRPFLRRPSC